MKKIIFIACMCFVVMGCKKEEVTPFNEPCGKETVDFFSRSDIKENDQTKELGSSKANYKVYDCGGLVVIKESSSGSSYVFVKDSFEKDDIFGDVMRGKLYEKGTGETDKGAYLNDIMFYWN